LPKLQTINRVSIDVKDLGVRQKQKKTLDLMDKLWRYCNTYRLVKPGKMDEEPTFYIMEEVGTSLNHSDKPNTKMAPIIYSPNCSSDD